MLGVDPERHVVEQDAQYDHERTEAGQKGHLVSKENDRGPDEEGSLARVGHAVGDRADVVHEHVGRDRLEVEEGAVDEQTGQHRRVCLSNLE